MVADFIKVKIYGKGNEGKFTLVSIEAYKRLNLHEWYFKMGEKGYVDIKKYNKGQQIISYRLHRYILGLEKADSRDGDHINGDILDNRCENLRITEKIQNQWNKRKRNGTKNKYIGVRENKYGTFNMSIKIGKEFINYTFKTAEDAAKAYNILALLHRGEYASLNDIDHEGFDIETARCRPLKNEIQSRFRGVYWLKEEQLWASRIKHIRKEYWLGRYVNEEDAAKAYNIRAIELLGENAKLNDVDHTGFLLPTLVPKGTKTSKYNGVIKEKDKWRVVVRDENAIILKRTGTYYSEEDAAKAYNILALELLRDEAELNPVDHTNFNWKKKTSSIYRGVSLHSKKWRSQIKKKGKIHSIGSFETEQEAALAYNQRALELFGDKAVFNMINHS